jgi:hypothetical protein
MFDEDIRAAIEGYEAQIHALNAHVVRLTLVLNAPKKQKAPKPAGPVAEEKPSRVYLGRKAKRDVSAKTRQLLSASSKRYWRQWRRDNKRARARGAA